MDTWQLYILAFNRRRTVYYYDGSDAEFPARRGWYVAEETTDPEEPILMGHRREHRPFHTEMDALRSAAGITDRLERSNRPPVQAHGAGVSMSSTFAALLRRIK